MFHELKILICGSLLALILRPCLISGRYVYNKELHTFFWFEDPSYGDAYNYGVTSAPTPYWGDPSLGGYYGIESASTPSWRDLREDIGCARIFQGPHFSGQSAVFQDSEKNPNWGNYHNAFIPSSVRVSTACSLTLYDHYWKKQAFIQDSGWISENAPVVGACCECNGCEGNSATKDLQCARLYEHNHCNGCDGYRLDLKSGDRVRHLGPLDNVMSSLIVRPGCHVVSYYERDFTGFRVNFTKSQDRLGDNWNKHISSVECHCPKDPYPYPTQAPPTPYPTWATYPTTTQSWTTYPTPTQPPTTPWTKPYWNTDTPATKPSWTTTWPPITTLETFYPTKTTPTKTTTEESSDSDEGDYEEITTTRATTTPTTTTPEPSFSEEDKDSTEEESPEYDEVVPAAVTKPVVPDKDDFDKDTNGDDDDDDDDDWGETEEDTDPEETTTTTPKPTTMTTTTPTTTTTRKTTTTTEKASAEDSDFDEDW